MWGGTQGFVLLGNTRQLHPNLPHVLLLPLSICLQVCPLDQWFSTLASFALWGGGHLTMCRAIKGNDLTIRGRATGM